jgi:polar amino acid transport system substrate-binding protein
MRARLALGAGLLLAATLAGCVTAPASTPGAAASAAAPAASSAAATPVTCSDATTSYQPTSTSAYVETIRQRKFLVAGVSADTQLLGAVTPANPDQFAGFDIEMVKAVAAAILPDVDPTFRIRFKVINAAQRIPQLSTDVDAADISQGGVDLVARAFTMNCARWQQVAFSGVYFQAVQKLLVASSDAVTGIGQLPAGSKVCAPKGSTSLDALAAYPNVSPVAVAVHTDCLALFQQSQVRAITGDDAILAGFKAQDPLTKVLPAKFGDPQPYGLGVNKAHPDFAAFINSVLEQLRSTGGWKKAYDATLGPALGTTETQPPAQYGRNP